MGFFLWLLVAICIDVLFVISGASVMHNPVAYIAACVLAGIMAAVAGRDT